MLSCGVMERVLAWARAESRLNEHVHGKKNCNLTDIPKLDDASNAGGSKSSKCSLIVTEGDSAKALATSGLSVVGRDNFGVFPLRGKLLNVLRCNRPSGEGCGQRVWSAMVQLYTDYGQ